MKRVIIIKIVIIPFLLISMSACKKFLDEKSDKRLAELRTLEDLQALLDNNDYMNKESTPGFGETSNDDHFLTVSDYNSLSLTSDQEAYTWRLNDYVYTNDWSVSYRGIYPANYCLEYIEKIERTTQNSNLWDNVKGSALFYRAYRFLCLIWEYGKAYDEITSKSDLGIVLRLNIDPSVASTRSNVKECYDRIIFDAMEAINYLPENPQHVMRPSKAAAYGLLARTYLSMRDYDNALKYANLCLGIKNSLLDYNDPEVTPSAPLSFPPFNKEIIFYTTQTQNYWPKHPAVAYIDTVLYNQYDINDIRKTAFFLPRNGYYYYKGTYSTVNREDFFTGIATDEIYLIRAECLARINKLIEALSDINDLLEKRWVTGTFIPIVTSNQQELLDLILEERRKELLMRGLRWIEIKRLNKEGANIVLKRVLDQVYTLEPNSEKYALPLPTDIIELTQMPQNPGW